MAEVIIATRNPGKVSLFKPGFAAFGLSCISLNEAALPVLRVDEDGSTPEENAMRKAKAYWQPGMTVFADDAGMEVEALGGEPGVQTRRWNGRFADNVDDDTWLDYLLSRLDGIPLEQRVACFVSGWALIGPQGESGTKRLVRPFLIAEQRIRPMTPGFPMSAVQIMQERPSDNQITELYRQLLIQEFGNWELFRYLLAQTAAV